MRTGTENISPKKKKDIKKSFRIDYKISMQFLLWFSSTNFLQNNWKVEEEEKYAKLRTIQSFQMKDIYRNSHRDKDFSDWAHNDIFVIQKQPKIVARMKRWMTKKKKKRRRQIEFRVSFANFFTNKTEICSLLNKLTNKWLFWQTKFPIKRSKRKLIYKLMNARWKRWNDK